MVARAVRPSLMMLLPQHSTQWLKARSRVLGIIGFACLLNACASTGQPVVTDRSLGDRSQGSYIVVRGDTLYSIAWRFNLDYRRLAAANNIITPHTIYPGQKIRLAETSSTSSASGSVAAFTAKPQGSRTPVAARPVVTASASTSVKKSAQTEPKPQRSKISQSEPKRTRPQVASSSSGQVWFRPLAQKPSALFGKNNKGLDYAISARSRVRSARSGEVVYAGNGIAGFERLVIVKHSNDLLSAYSFNGKIQVNEQQRVRGGAIIAEILPRPGVGQTLHFEVRKKGQPVDPQKLIL